LPSIQRDATTPIYCWKEIFDYHQKRAGGVKFSPRLLRRKSPIATIIKYYHQKSNNLGQVPGYHLS
jgi:hypothetical protein